MINRSRGEIAYTMIDAAIFRRKLKELKKELLEIPEVIRVRALHNPKFVK